MSRDPADYLPRRDLAEFIAARLNEDQYLVSGFAFTGDTEWDAEMLGRLFWYGDGSAPKSRPADDPVIRHLARHDAARVLREIEAGRMILARYEDTLARQEDDNYPAGVAQNQAREYEDFVLPNLAAAWNNHPDYRPEWKP